MSLVFKIVQVVDSLKIQQVGVSRHDLVQEKMIVANARQEQHRAVQQQRLLGFEVFKDCEYVSWPVFGIYAR